MSNPVETRTLESPQEPFVGRRQELERLGRALDEAMRGRGTAFALVGEAGIGKTRLAGEIVELALDAGLRVGIARCTEVAGAPAFWPWIEALRGIAPRRGDALPPGSAFGLEELYALLARLGIELPQVRAIGDEARFALLDAVVRGITNVAADKPLLLLFDDAHWADADSIVLLKELARRSEHSPLLLIATYRDDGSEAARRDALIAYERAAERIPLSGLEASGAARLVEWATGREPTERRVLHLLERSGGNPLLLGELARVPADAPLPGSVRQALAPRFDGLGESATRVLERAAVLGRSFETGMLQHLDDVPRPELREALDELCRRGLLRRRSDDGYDFAHSLIHEVAYEGVPSAERASIHARVAAQLNASGATGTEAEKARLAHHLIEANDAESLSPAIAHAQGAAALARQGLSLHRAADHLRLALRAQRGLSPSGEAQRRQRLELLLALGEVQGQVGARAEARSTFDEAANLARALGDARALGKAAAGWIGFEEAPLAFSPEALARIEEALAALEGEDSSERARLLALFVHYLWFWRRFERCEQVAREAVACAERQDDPVDRVHAMISLHRAVTGPERLDERLAISRSAVELASTHAPRHVEAMARRRLAMDLLQRGDVAAGRRELLHVTRIWEELRKPVDGWSIAALQAAVALLHGELADADRLVPEVWRLGREVESRVSPVIFIAQLSRLREHQGRLEEIVDLLEKQVDAHPEVPALGWTLRMALMHLDRRDALRASFDAAAARSFDDIERDENWSPVLCAAAQIAHTLGDRARAERIHELLLPYDGLHVVVGYGHYWVGAAARFLALLEHTLGRPEAGAHFDEAIASHRRAGARPLLADTLVESGRWHADQGDSVEARRRLEEAREIYTVLGIAPRVDRVSSELRALGAAPGGGPGEARSSEPALARLIREGERWRVEFAGEVAWVDDRKGLGDVVQLVEWPGRELHVLDLMDRAPLEPSAREPGLRAGAGPAGGAGLDAEARGAYRARHADLRASLEEARSRNDLAAERSLREEIDWLESELRGALRGGDGPDFVQRARKAVYNRIRTAISSIERVHPGLGRHLRHGIQTGEVCRYAPERVLRWELGPESMD